MRARFSFESRLFRAALALGFLVCLIGGSPRPTQAATGEGQPFPASKSVLLGSNYVSVLSLDDFDSLRTGHTEFSVPDEFEVAIEDEASIELFRADTPQCIFGVDQPVLTLEVTSKVTWSTHPKTSPPLLE